MFGKIISISENVVKVKNNTNVIQSNVVNLHLVFESGNTKIVGEIFETTPEYFLINIIGEIDNCGFHLGSIKKPVVDSNIRLVYKNEVELLLGKQTFNDMKNLYLGKSLVYNGFNVSVDINNFFSNHFAVIGNTGAGKSCGVARILQNIFFQDKEHAPVNANIVLFDVYGEYHNAFKNISEIKDINYKSVTTKIKFGEGDTLNIPAYYLDIDDLAILLRADDPMQVAVIDKALTYAKVFASEEDKVIKYKNDIIARALQDILASGKSSTQIRDQIIAVLTRYNTRELNLDSQVIQPGYIRTIKQCLNIDQTGKINSINLVVDLLKTFIDDNIVIELENTDIIYSLKDLYAALEFASISEGSLKSDKAFDKVNDLLVRLNAIINSEYATYFEIGDEYLDKNTFINNFFLASNGAKAQIVNVNVHYVEERFAKAITKIYSKLFFDFALRQENKGSFPIQIIIEEAHRYVTNDNDLKIIGYNIFDRITKEGRKYGVVLGLITQRPTELSSVTLSQCSNFIVFRTYHPDDTKLIENISTSVSEQNMRMLRTLQPGHCLAFGTGFKVPCLIKLEYPEPAPSSLNSDITNIWYTKKN